MRLMSTKGSTGCPLSRKDQKQNKVVSRLDKGGAPLVCIKRITSYSNDIRGYDPTIFLVTSQIKRTSISKQNLHNYVILMKV